MNKHNWSGWPGAYCLKCGAGDPAELCIAVHDKLDYVCLNCGEHWPMDECIATHGEHAVKVITCPDHPETECPIESTS